MGWSINLGRFLGIDIKVHWAFFLILIWGAFSYGGNAGPLYGLLVTLALFTLVLLHEMGHSLAARAYGIGVRDITLLPIGGVARLERMPDKPAQELVVALAGPAVNVVLAVGLLPVAVGLAMGQDMLSLSAWMQPGWRGLLLFLLSANVTLAAFNLIPAFPLDGGRVFRALLGMFVDYQRATHIAVNVGRFLAVALGVFAVLNGQFLLAFIALFIFTASGQEGQAAAMRGLLSNVQVKQTLPNNRVMLSPEATVAQVTSMALEGNQANLAVVDAASGELLGVVHAREVARSADLNEWHKTMRELMSPVEGVPKVTLGSTLAEVFDSLTQASSRVAAVYEGIRFYGLIGWEDVWRVYRYLSRNNGAGQQPAWRTIA
jgi:Zn-dependent protease/CBS domain-containing protein